MVAELGTPNESRLRFGLRARPDEQGVQAVAQVSGTLMPVIFYSSL